MSLKELTLLIAPPSEPAHIPKKPSWETVERSLGLKLPRDYKGFIVTYGSGLFAEFIRIFNPFDDDEYMSLLRSAKSVSDMYRHFKEKEGDKVLPFPLHPEKGGLVPCGNDENGNYLFWLANGPPSKWSIVVAEGRGPRWQKFDYPLVSFLVAVLQKSIRCKIWPASFPSKKRNFKFTLYD